MVAKELRVEKFHFLLAQKILLLLAQKELVSFTFSLAKKRGQRTIWLDMIMAELSYCYILD